MHLPVGAQADLFTRNQGVLPVRLARIVRHRDRAFGQRDEHMLSFTLHLKVRAQRSGVRWACRDDEGSRRVVRYFEERAAVHELDLALASRKGDADFASDVEVDDRTVGQLHVASRLLGC